MTRSFAIRSSWSFADKIAGFAALLLVVVFVFGDVFGRIEGRLFPVASDFTVSAVIGPTDRSMIVSGSFDILRPGCGNAEVRWLLSNGERTVPVTLEFLNGARVRSGGANAFSNWLVGVPVESLEDSIVIVSHQCPFRPWRTVTQLYP